MRWTRSSARSGGSRTVTHGARSSSPSLMAKFAQAIDDRHVETCPLAPLLRGMVRDAHRRTDGDTLMTRYLVGVTFEPGVVDTPMEEWRPEDIQAHLDYYAALNRELKASGELVDGVVLTGPDLAMVVTADGATAPVVTDGPFAEFKEWLAGYQIVDVESIARAIEIAALVSAAPRPGGGPLQQPIHLRQIMDESPSNPDE